MAGFWAALHVVRLVLDLARRMSDWSRDQTARRRTIDELRLKSRRLLDRARAARRSFQPLQTWRNHRSRRSRRNDDPERLRHDDGFRRD